MAALLAGGVEKPDYVARIGGDEFAVVLFGPTKARMEELDRHYQAAVEAYNREKPHLPLSLSIGWAMDADPANVDLVHKNADSQMYRVKMHQSQSVRGALVQTMMKALEAKDHITEAMPTASASCWSTWASGCCSPRAISPTCASWPNSTTSAKSASRTASLKNPAG